MVRNCWSLLMGLIWMGTLRAQSNQPDLSNRIQGELIRQVASLKTLEPASKFNPPVTRNLSGAIYKKTWKDSRNDMGTKASGDPVIQHKFFHAGTKASQSAQSPLAGSKMMQNYDGMSFTNVAPADPCLAQGPGHVIQMINGSQGAYFKIWDKNGNLALDKTYMYQLIGTAGYAGWGDPIVQYDVFADRYILSEFGSSNGITSFANTLIFAVSKTSNPIDGGWYIYKFTDNSAFMDYPHFSTWPHHIFGTTNDFNTAGNSYLGSSLIAFEKDKMMQGLSNPTMIRTRPHQIIPDINKQGTLAPVGISGTTPPSQQDAGLFLYYSDDNYTSSNADVDSVGMVQFIPDFSNPSNSSVQLIAQLPVAAFKSNVCAGKDCIPGGAGYDAISDRFMHRIQYRNFGSYESIVANHTVDVNYPSIPSKAGIRWYEFRNNSGSWKIQQQGTYAPDADSRWMGVININSKGQIALGFNYSGTGKFASIGFTGRNQNDPPGMMSYDETIVKAGTAYGTYGNRWGDYNDLTTDVSNDSIFWMTSMYGDVNWKTRIAAFKLEALPVHDARLSEILSPAVNGYLCDKTFTPSVIIRNTGTADLTQLKIYTQLNNGTIQGPINWTGQLSITTADSILLPPLTGVYGKNQLKVFVAAPNGFIDEQSNNDTLTQTFTIQTPLTSTFKQSFDSTAFPTDGWRVENKAGIGWEKNTTGPHTGTAAAKMDFFNNELINDEDYLLLPYVDVNQKDSVILSFWNAYAPYDNTAQYADGLAVVISTDCGQTFTEVWKKEGVALSTVIGNRTEEFIPQPDDYAFQQINLQPFIPVGTQGITIGFKGINKYGNSLYLDDVQFRTVKIASLDASIIKVEQPGSILCNKTVTPTLKIRNAGLETIDSVKIFFKINNNASDSIHWKGKLSSGQEVMVNFSGFNKNLSFASAGKYTLRFYTQWPNGKNDQQVGNDTATVLVTYFEPKPAPIKSSFETNITDWGVVSSGGHFTWEQTNLSGSSSDHAMWIKNYRFDNQGAKDDLFSPLTKIAQPDSVYLQFDVAHATQVYPGSTTLPLDTLEVLLTKDCGISFQSIYKKWGYELSTFSKNFPSLHPATDTIGFVPNGNQQWRTEWLNISAFVQNESNFQVVFRNTSHQGNNTYIDNVQISPVTLPAHLKQEGYLLVPNPFVGGFGIRHLTNPTTLKKIQVMNMMGQLIYQRNFPSNADKYIWVDMNVHPAGTYQIKMTYEDKIITERIIKIK